MEMYFNNNEEESDLDLLLDIMGCPKLNEEEQKYLLNEERYDEK